MASKKKKKKEEEEKRFHHSTCLLFSEPFLPLKWKYQLQARPPATPRHKVDVVSSYIPSLSLSEDLKSFALPPSIPLTSARMHVLQRLPFVLEIPGKVKGKFVST